jgi:hypothetical protein
MCSAEVGFCCWQKSFPCIFAVDSERHEKNQFTERKIDCRKYACFIYAVGGQICEVEPNKKSTPQGASLSFARSAN